MICLKLSLTASILAMLLLLPAVATDSKALLYASAITAAIGAGTILAGIWLAL